MSQLSVIYELKANLVGLKKSANDGALPDGKIIFGQTRIVKIRAHDPPNKQGITQETGATTKGTLFNSTGSCSISGHLPSDVAYIKQEAQLTLYINNS